MIAARPDNVPCAGSTTRRQAYDMIRRPTPGTGARWIVP